MAAKRKAKPKAKRGRGRPTKYRPEYCARVVEMGKEGKSLATMACELEVHRETLHDWAAANPDFSVAMTHARNASLSWWEDKARRGIVTQDGVSINAALWGKVMSARFPDDYREKKDLHVTGKMTFDQVLDEVAGGDEGG